MILVFFFFWLLVNLIRLCYLIYYNKMVCDFFVWLYYFFCYRGIFEGLLGFVYSLCLVYKVC